MIILCWGPLLSARLVPKSSIFTPKTSNLEHELSRNLFLLFLPLAANWSLTDQCFQNEKAVSLDSRYEGTKSFTPCPQKIGLLIQITNVVPRQVSILFFSKSKCFGGMNTKFTAQIFHNCHFLFHKCKYY